MRLHMPGKKSADEISTKNCCCRRMCTSRLRPNFRQESLPLAQPIQTRSLQFRNHAPSVTSEPPSRPPTVADIVQPRVKPCGEACTSRDGEKGVGWFLGGSWADLSPRGGGGRTVIKNKRRGNPKGREGAPFLREQRGCTAPSSPWDARGGG